MGLKLLEHVVQRGEDLCSCLIVRDSKVSRSHLLLTFSCFL